MDSALGVQIEASLGLLVKLSGDEYSCCFL